MFWPRVHVPNRLAKLGWKKYRDPNTGNAAPFRRMYAGHLEINQTEQNPLWPFQIAREAHVLAITAIGDLHQMRIQLKDSSGETYFTEPTLASAVFGGFSYSGAQDPLTGMPLLPSRTGLNFTVCPFVFEPNLILLPNQVLNIQASPIRPYDREPYRIDFTLHVVEYSA